jgi:hypothetical protein
MVNGMTTDVFWMIKCVENTVIFFYCNAKQDLPNQEILFFYNSALLSLYMLQDSHIGFSPITHHI